MIDITMNRSDINLSARDWKKTTKELFLLGARYWKEKILPRHFQHGAAAKYKYDKRNENYEIRKRKRKGHTTPLVYSGNMRDMLLDSDNIKNVGAETAVVILAGPRYLPLHRRKLNEPDKAAEILAITKDEEKEIANVMDAELQRRFDKSGIGTKTNASAERVKELRGQIAGLRQFASSYRSFKNTLRGLV